MSYERLADELDRYAVRLDHPDEHEAMTDQGVAGLRDLDEPYWAPTDNSERVEEER